MATNLALNDRLIQQAVRIGKFKSKREAVNTALAEYVSRHSQAAILELAGKIEYLPDYDHKKTPFTTQVAVIVLIDTTVWSLGLRRRLRDLNPEEKRAYFEWDRLLHEGNAAIIGLIRQEVLSGIGAEKEFETLHNRLEAIPDLNVTTETYVLAAEFYNKCRRKGAAPGPIDMTICAAAHVHGMPIFAVDPDFSLYAQHLPIQLHSPRAK